MTITQKCNFFPSFVKINPTLFVSASLGKIGERNFSVFTVKTRGQIRQQLNKLDDMPTTILL
jgi:hypothetical protein